MRLEKKIIFIATLLLLTTTLPATKYAGDFEQLGASARAIGMGGAMSAAAGDPSAIYYNPALASRLPRPSALLLHSEDFSGLVKHNFIGVILPNNCQAFGIALFHNGIPGIKLTALPDSTQPPGENNRPYVVRTVNANQLIGYFSYSRLLSSILAAGGNVKIIYQNLGNTASCLGMGIDLGILLSPLRNFDVGLRIRNASTSPLFWNTGARENITPNLALGISKLFPLGRDRLRLAIETEANLEEKSLVPNFGLEYSFREILFGRIGSYRNNFSFGVGFKFKRFHIDYGYASGTAPEARELGSPQQLSGGVEF